MQRRAICMVTQTMKLSALQHYEFNERLGEAHSIQMRAEAIRRMDLACEAISLYSEIVAREWIGRLDELDAVICELRSRLPINDNQPRE